MISFFVSETDFKFKRKKQIVQWLGAVALSESRCIDKVSIVFCSDDYLLGVNRRFLGHDYYTDIITFDYCQADKLSGDLMISVDSVMSNAREYGVDFDTELNRVIVHGLLHLIGYDDHTEEEQKEMRAKEDAALEMLKTLES